MVALTGRRVPNGRYDSKHLSFRIGRCPPPDMDQLEACSVKVGSPNLTCERGVRLGLSKPVLRLAGVVAEVGGAQAADVEGEAPPAALLVEQLTVSLVQLLVAPEPRYLQGSGMSSSGITYSAHCLYGHHLHEYIQAGPYLYEWFER